MHSAYQIIPAALAAALIFGLTVLLIKIVLMLSAWVRLEAAQLSFRKTVARIEAEREAKRLMDEAVKKGLEAAQRARVQLPTYDRPVVVIVTGESLADLYLGMVDKKEVAYISAVRKEIDAMTGVKK